MHYAEARFSELTIRERYGILRVYDIEIKKSPHNLNISFLTLVNAFEFQLTACGRTGAPTPPAASPVGAATRAGAGSVRPRSMEGQTAWGKRPRRIRATFRIAEMEHSKL